MTMVYIRSRPVAFAADPVTEITSSLPFEECFTRFYDF
jgi:hypothetical protein